MLNPLSKKDPQLPRGKPSKEQRKQNPSEIYCILCRVKYSIEGYRQHIHQHKRKPKMSISSCFSQRKEESNATLVDGDSLYILNQDGPHETKRQEGFYASAAHSYIHKSMQKQTGTSSNEAAAMKLGTRHNPFHTAQLKKSVTFSEQGQQPFQNPESREQKCSIIDNLKSQRYIQFEEANFSLETSPKQAKRSPIQPSQPRTKPINQLSLKEY